MKTEINYIKKHLSKKLFVVGAIAVLISSVGCEKFLEVDEPQNQISQSMVFKDKKLAYAALSDVYSNLRSNTMLNGGLAGVGTLMGCYADELTSVSNQPVDFRSFYELGVQPNTPTVNTLWVNSYKQIYAVNSIIEGVLQSVAYLDESTMLQILGEAYFIRGLLHFYMVEMYGDIPYVSTTDYNINQSVSRMPVSEVYLRIEEDLKKAETMLSDTYPSANRTHINRSGVRLFLARLYLYQNKWSEAKNYASLVIQNPAYSVEQDLSKTFLKDSKSAVWQFMPVDAGINTLEGQYYTFLTLPPANVVLSQSLLNSFEDGDQRKVQWTKTLSNSQMTYSHAYKYKQYNKTSTTSLEYSVVLRIEEAYLILAESENELGNIGSALVAVNKLRTRAGLTVLSGLSQQQLRTAILDERRHELFTEFGHRFFDLKRKGLLDNTLSPLKPAWQNFRKLLPLPERELFANPKLNPQNEGY